MNYYEDFVKQAQLEEEAEFLMEDICKQCLKYNLNIKLNMDKTKNGLFLFSVKLKGNTREAHLRANAADIQLKLKLPVFYVHKENFTLYLIVSRKKPKYSHLTAILHNNAYGLKLGHMELPYVVGYDVLGNPVTIDLAKSPHLLLGGATNSGKSVGLQALITCITYSKPPSSVNLILIDVGARDLMPFERLPHLSCPVASDHDTAFHTLAALKDEMEQRIELEYTNPDKFNKLPLLVIIIDEFPALFMGLWQQSMSKQLVHMISSILQRGRHARIHMIMAAQNPTIQNMKVDLGNITTRIAFKCAKKNFSETILGERGAENLLGKGDMLLKSPQHDGLQRIQGVFITTDEIRQTVQQIQERPYSGEINKFNVTIPGGLSEYATDNPNLHLRRATITELPSREDQLLSAVIMWALERDKISTNILMKEFHLGWNKAATLVNQLAELGIVDKPEGKQARRVLPGIIQDLSEELIEFMRLCGYTDSSLNYVFCER